MSGKENFEVVLRDRHECEYLLAQVRYQNIGVCEINREKGTDQMEVEMLCNDPLYNGLEIRFPFDDFLEALKAAKAALMDR